MADINEIKDAVKAKFNAVADKTIEYAGKTKEYAEKASVAAKGVTALAKLNLELNSERENINKAYLEIGKLYYQTHRDLPEGFFVQLCDEITLSTANAETLQEQIAMLKSELDPRATGEEDDFVIELESVPIVEAPVVEAPVEETPVEECAEENTPNAD